MTANAPAQSHVAWSLRLASLVLLGIELALIAIFAYGMVRWIFEWRLSGPRTQAEIVAIDAQGGEHFITYRYAVDGQAYLREHRVSAAFAEARHVGEALTVVLSPADESISGIPGQGRADFDLPRLPATPFNLTILIYVLPAALVINLIDIVTLRWVARLVARREQERLQ